MKHEMHITENVKTAKRVAEYFEENENTGIALGKALEYLFNNFSSDRMAKDAAEYICTRAHRTLQQSIIRGVFILLRRMATVEYYDDRNEASVKAAKAAIKAIDDENIAFPFI